MDVEHNVSYFKRRT